MSHLSWRATLLLGALFMGVLSCGSSDNPSSSFWGAQGGAGGTDAGSGWTAGSGGSSGLGGSGSGTPATGTAGTGQGGESSASSGTTTLFSKPHSWTKDVSSVGKSTRSDAITAALTTLGGWGNGNKFQVDFAFALLTADASTPRKTVSGIPDYCYGGGPDCDTVPIQMPIPVIGNTEGSPTYECDRENNDCHVLVIDTSQKKLYELYSATQSGTEFVALGAFVWDLDKQYSDTLRGEQCTSSDAAGLPIAALLPTADQVASGDIGHALRFILPNPRMKAKVYVRPATHAGGPSSTNPDAPPYGVRFRLRDSFDETSYSQGGKVVIRALKKYGMILSDGGQIALTFADDKHSTAKWSTLGIEAQTFGAIKVGDFEVVDLGAEIPLTFDCVRSP